MMDCEDVAGRDRIERYVREELSPAERDALERHVLVCQHCFQELRLALASRLALREG